MKDSFNYAYYLVAFIDVLGQKEAFNGIKDIPNTEEGKKKLIKAHSETVLFVEDLREWFDDYFNAYTEDKESIYQVPSDKKALFDEMRKSVLKHTRFSDCIQAFVPLQSGKYHSPCINGVFGVLGACGGMFLLSLARRKSLRIGIDIGIATELTTNEVYGPGFFNAYTLESKIAQYPRIVIGGTLINYLMNLSHKNPQFPDQIREDIEHCKVIADNCLTMVVRDLDGFNMLDYLGKNFVDNFTRHIPEDQKEDSSKVFEMAFRFVEDEFKRLRNSRDQKLSTRYFMLYNYFKTKFPQIDVKEE